MYDGLAYGQGREYGKSMSLNFDAYVSYMPIEDSPNITFSFCAYRTSIRLVAASLCFGSLTSNTPSAMVAEIASRSISLDIVKLRT